MPTILMQTYHLQTLPSTKILMYKLCQLLFKMKQVQKDYSTGGMVKQVTFLNITTLILHNGVEKPHLFH